MKHTVPKQKVLKFNQTGRRFQMVSTYIVLFLLLQIKLKLFRKLCKMKIAILAIFVSLIMCPSPINTCFSIRIIVTWLATASAIPRGVLIIVHFIRDTLRLLVPMIGKITDVSALALRVISCLMIEDLGEVMCVIGLLYACSTGLQLHIWAFCYFLEFASCCARWRQYQYLKIYVN